MSDGQKEQLEGVMADWKLLSNQPSDKQNEVVQLLHQAAQYIAMLGKHYADHEPDDSHTNMEWLVEHEALAGIWIQGSKPFRLALRPSDFSLFFLDEALAPIRSTKLSGKTKEEIKTWIVGFLKEMDLPSEDYDLELHYEIPVHEVDAGLPFVQPSTELLQEHSKWRHNSQAILQVLGRHFEHASAIRTWPHHFDTGLYIPVEVEGENVKRSFSTGWSIADEYIDEPYFYITMWSGSNDIDFDNLPDLEIGEWHTDGFHMLVLRSSKVSQYSSVSEQCMIAQAFLAKGAAIALGLLKIV